MVTLLKSVGATHCSETLFTPQPTNEDGSDAGAINLQPDHNKISQKYKELNDVVKTKRNKYQQTESSVVACEALDALQQVDVYRMSNGCKILCLDGGGVRGLVQIEMLRQIEQKTGKKIVNLFDWIVGTSTGGIIALALVYGMYIPIKHCMHYSVALYILLPLQLGHQLQIFRDFICGSKEKCFHQVESIKLKRAIASNWSGT